MKESNEIFVINNNQTNKLKIKGSQFIGNAFKISDQKQAQYLLQLIKKEHYNASHHCFAYRTKYGAEKYSDDGEPNGTAGIRILNAINHFILSDILVVVVRYFGGTKLGIGHLGKAYSETAVSLFQKCNIIQLIKYKDISISFKYNETNIVHYLLNKYKCKKIENRYSSSPLIQSSISYKNIKKFEAELSEKTAGNAQLRVLDTHSYLRLR